MGLHVQSLKELHENVERGYYIYLLDYGWHEPLREVLKSNFENMARIASESDAVVIAGTNSVHFEDEVFSWHNINGHKADNGLLPAILITNRHPAKFKETYSANQNPKAESDLKIVLLPIRKFCNTTEDVIPFIHQIFRNIKDKKDLNEFRISETIKRSGRNVADEIILEPNPKGTGLSFKKLNAFLNPNSESNNIIQKTVLPIHFEDRSGIEFERLVFAYVNKVKRWESIQWLGQTGKENGRDIWGVYDSQTTCYQCANHRQVAFKKAKDDIDKLVKAEYVPDNFVLVCGGTVTAKTRKEIAEYAKSKNITNVDIWSGVEFEEKLRLDATELIKRFVEGEAFPETPLGLIGF